MRIWRMKCYVFFNIEPLTPALKHLTGYRALANIILISDGNGDSIDEVFSTLAIELTLISLLSGSLGDADTGRYVRYR